MVENRFVEALKSKDWKTAEKLVMFHPSLKNFPITSLDMIFVEALKSRDWETADMFLIYYPCTSKSRYWYKTFFEALDEIFFKALKSKDWETVEKLLMYNPCLKRDNEYLDEIFVEVMKSGDWETVKKLVMYYPSLKTKKITSLDEIFVKAMKSGDWQTAEKLVMYHPPLKTNKIASLDEIFVKAMKSRNWEITEKLVMYHLPLKTDKITSLDETFVKVVKSGDWETIKKLVMHHPRLETDNVTSWKETALHVAVLAGKEQIVEKLVERMEQLGAKDNEGYSAFDQAIIHDKLCMVECMLKKDKDLIISKTLNGQIPVVLAIDYGKKDMARYLYRFTPLEYLMQDEVIHGATICTHAIYNRMLEIALDLIKHHQPLTLALDLDGRSPLYALASTPNALKQPVFWKQWICFVYCYSCCSSFNRSDTQIQSTPANDEIRVNVRSEQAQTNKSVPALWRQLVSNLHKLLVKHLEEKNSFDSAHELLGLMGDQISISNDQDKKIGLVSTSVSLAIREGIFDFINKILKKSDVFKWSVDPAGRTILSNAVLHRQAKIYREILKSPEGGVMKNSIDKKKNNILHIAGMLGPETRLDVIPGAALQMQNELRWFKEVESIVLPSMTKASNEDGLTPQELFTKNHMALRKKGEKWMKSTATSCTVIGALIITIMFAVAFTVPGGYNQETSSPMFLNERAFKLFIVCDSISLISSTTSVLMFLGILTSRYAEEDFLKSLPKKMIIGFSTLFFSIATMMIAFCAALVVMLRGEASIFTPIICLACLPVTLFVVMQFHPFIDICKSTYGSSIWM